MPAGDIQFRTDQYLAPIEDLTRQRYDRATSAMTQMGASFAGGMFAGRQQGEQIAWERQYKDKLLSLEQDKFALSKTAAEVDTYFRQQELIDNRVKMAGDAAEQAKRIARLDAQTQVLTSVSNQKMLKNQALVSDEQALQARISTMALAEQNGYKIENGKIVKASEQMKLPADVGSPLYTHGDPIKMANGTYLDPLTHKKMTREEVIARRRELSRTMQQNQLQNINYTLDRLEKAIKGAEDSGEMDLAAQYRQKHRELSDMAQSLLTGKPPASAKPQQTQMLRSGADYLNRMSDPKMLAKRNAQIDSLFSETKVQNPDYRAALSRLRSHVSNYDEARREQFQKEVIQRGVPVALWPEAAAKMMLAHIHGQDLPDGLKYRQGSNEYVPIGEYQGKTFKREYRGNVIPAEFKGMLLSDQKAWEIINRYGPARAAGKIIKPADLSDSRDVINAFGKANLREFVNQMGRGPLVDFAKAEKAWQAMPIEKQFETAQRLGFWFYDPAIEQWLDSTDVGFFGQSGEEKQKKRNVSLQVERLRRGK